VTPRVPRLAARGPAGGMNPRHSQVVAPLYVAASMHRTRLAVALALVCLVSQVAAARAAAVRRVRSGVRRRSTRRTARPSMPTSCGRRAPGDAKTPVIVSIGPYFSHSGQEGPIGAARAPRPMTRSARWPVRRIASTTSSTVRTLCNGLHVRDGRPARLRRQHRLSRLGRPGRAGRRRRRGDVGRRPAVVHGTRRALRQVYDGETGLVGVANRPRGLTAVVSGEPVYDGYRYLFSTASAT